MNATRDQWESRNQIRPSEASQVKVRAAQSWTFDTTDRLKTIQAVVSTFQDLGLPSTYWMGVGYRVRQEVRRL